MTRYILNNLQLYNSSIQQTDDYILNFGALHFPQLKLHLPKLEPIMLNETNPICIL